VSVRLTVAVIRAELRDPDPGDPQTEYGTLSLAYLIPTLLWDGRLMGIKPSSEFKLAGVGGMS
jgi:hypothetical protein